MRMAGPVSPSNLAKYTPSMADTMATMLADVSFCVTMRQMKIEVMANDAMLSGMLRALPTSTPTTLESVQELWENKLVMSARSTDQSPSAKRWVETP